MDVALPIEVMVRFKSRLKEYREWIESVEPKYEKKLTQIKPFIPFMLEGVDYEENGRWCERLYGFIDIVKMDPDMVKQQCDNVSFPDMWRATRWVEACKGEYASAA